MLNNKTSLLSVILYLSVLASSMYPLTVIADVLAIPKANTSTDHAELPQNGSSKVQVKEQYGAAQTELAPVGDPPITRWDYADFSVFFEYERVITAVLKPQQAANADNK